MSNKICNLKKYSRMPAAGVDMTNAHWLKMAARLGKVNEQQKKKKKKKNPHTNHISSAEKSAEAYITNILQEFYKLSTLKLQNKISIAQND